MQILSVFHLALSDYCLSNQGFIFKKKNKKQKNNFLKQSLLQSQQTFQWLFITDSVLAVFMAV